MSIAYQWKMKEKEAAAAAAAAMANKTGIAAARGKAETAGKDASGAAAVDESTQRANVPEKSGKPEDPTGHGPAVRGTALGKPGPGTPGPPSAQGTAPWRQSSSKPEVLPTQGTTFGKQGSTKTEILPAPGTAPGKQCFSRPEVLPAPGTALGKQSSNKPEVLAAPGTTFGKPSSSRLPVVGKDNLKISQTKETESATAALAASSPTKDGRQLPGGPAALSKIPVVGAKETVATSGVRKPFGAAPKKEEPTPSNKLKSPDEISSSKTLDGKRDPAAAAAASKDAGAAAADEGPFGSGRTRGLAGFWANQNDEVKTVKKKRLTAVEESLPPTIVESKPQHLEGVVRAEDPGEWKKPLQLEQGATKNVVSSFQKRQQEPFAKKNAVTLADNNNSDDKSEIPIKVKDISQRLARQKNEPASGASKDKLFLDLSQGAVVLAENQPEEGDPNVVRSDGAAKEEVVLEKGRTRNLLQHWKNTEVEYNAPKTSTHRYQGAKPEWILEIEAAKGKDAAEKNEDEESVQRDDNNRQMAADDAAERSETGSQLQEGASREAEPEQRNLVAPEGGSLPIPRENENAVTVETLKTAIEEPPFRQERIGEDKPNKEIAAQVSSIDSILQQVASSVTPEISMPIETQNPESEKDREDEAKLKMKPDELITNQEEVPVTRPVETAASVQVLLGHEHEQPSTEVKSLQNEPATQEASLILTQPCPVPPAPEAELQTTQENTLNLQTSALTDDKQTQVAAQLMSADLKKQNILPETDTTTPEEYTDTFAIHTLLPGNAQKQLPSPETNSDREETFVECSFEKVTSVTDGGDRANLTSGFPTDASAAPESPHGVGDETNRNEVERLSSAEEFYDTQSSAETGFVHEKHSEALTEGVKVISGQASSALIEPTIASGDATKTDTSRTFDTELTPVDSHQTEKTKPEKQTQLTLDDLLRLDSSSVEYITDETPCLVPSTPESLSAPYVPELDASTAVSGEGQVNRLPADEPEHTTATEETSSKDSNVSLPSKDDDGKDSVQSGSEQPPKSEPAAQRSCRIM